MDVVNDIADRAKLLADQHWKYVRELLLAHGLGGEEVGIAEYHYLSAFRHGYKHAMEDAADESADKTAIPLEACALAEFAERDRDFHDSGCKPCRDRRASKP